MKLDRDPDYRIGFVEVGAVLLAVLVLVSMLLWALGPEFKRRQRADARAAEAQVAIGCFNQLAVEDSTITLERAWWICHPPEGQKP